MATLELVALVVRDYDAAIRFFVDVLGFELVEDTPSLTNDGRPKRWVVVRPVGGTTGVLLARADGDHQAGIVGQQFAGRVGLFLRADDFESLYQRMIAAGVHFVSPPRTEAYGTVAVFLDLEGNRWDLLGPDPRVRVPQAVDVRTSKQAMVIKTGDFADDRVKALLTRHLEGMHANSPAGHVFALDWSGLQMPEISFYALWEGEELLGFGALKELDSASGEIKSMRTADAHLRKGVASRILDHIVVEAQRRGYTRLSLETGSGPAFEPALALYRNRGFVQGGPFGGYEKSSFNQFLHLQLSHRLIC